MSQFGGRSTYDPASAEMNWSTGLDMEIGATYRHLVYIDSDVDYSLDTDEYRRLIPATMVFYGTMPIHIEVPTRNLVDQWRQPCQTARSSVSSARVTVAHMLSCPTADLSESKTDEHERYISGESPRGVA